MAIPGIPSLYGSTSRPGSFTFPTQPASQRRQQFTNYQMIRMMLANQQANEGRSFWDKVKSGGGGLLKGALNIISRPGWAISAGVERATLGNKGFDVSDFFHGAATGIKGQRKIGFGQLLDQWGVLEDHKFVRGLAGFGLDVITDPTTYLTFGTAGLAKGAATSATRAALKGFAETGVTRAVGLNMVRELETKGGQFAARTALARHELGLLERGAATEYDIATRNVLRRAAAEEIENTDRKLLQLAFQVPFTGGKKVKFTPTHVAGQRVAPQIPSVRALSNRNIPLLSAGARAGSNLFRPDIADPLHAVNITIRHQSERLSDEALHDPQLMEFMRTTATQLDKDQMFDALIWAEREKVVNPLRDADQPHGVKLELDDARITQAVNHGTLTVPQAKFIKVWHDHFERLRAKDAEFGIEYKGKLPGEDGALYVPHLYTKQGTQLSHYSQKQSIFNAPGFSYERLQKADLGTIKELAESGAYGKLVETDPLKLLAMRTRRSGAKWAEMAGQRAAVLMSGTPTRLVDTGKLARVEGLKDRAAARIEKLTRDIENNYLPPALRRKNLRGAALRSAQGKVRRDLEQKLAREERLLEKYSLFETRIRRGKKNPEAKNLKEVDYPDEFGNNYALPREVSEALLRANKAVTDDETANALARAYNTFLSKWKIAVTTINPSYRARNSLSDVWNMYIAGVPAGSIAKYMGVAMGHMVTNKKALRKLENGQAITAKEQKVIDELINAYDAGVLSGLFQGDIQTVAQRLRYGGSKRALAKDKRFIALIAKVATDVNRNSENFGRLAHYLYRRSKGMDVQEAAREVRKAHFDYEDLTEFERRVMKKVFPFYTWTRKNIPFQLQQLVSQPGRFSAFPKFAWEMEYAAQGEQNDLMPDFLKENMAIAFPGASGSYLLPQIGAIDLLKLENPKQFLNMITPVVKVPGELIFNKNQFTGQPIREGPHPRRVPIAGWMAEVLENIGLGNVADVGQTSRFVHGRRVYGAGADPLVGYFARQMPWLNYLINQGSSIKEAQRGNNNATIGALTGLTFYEVDQDAELLGRTYENEEATRAFVRRLRDEGLYPEAEQDDPSFFESRLQELIKRNYSRGG